MKNYEIELRVLNIVDRVKNNQPLEDAFVELKSKWIEPEKAARLIAGHANSARGENIVWIIGLDEKKGVVGATREEFSNWLAKVRSNFNGLAPEVIDLNVPIDGKTVVALLFSTDRAPYVTKTQAGKSPQLEVPWREGTSIRTATRLDLIKILAPLQKLPTFEELEGDLFIAPSPNGTTLYLEISVYVTPGSQEQIVFPFHLSSINVQFPGLEKIDLPIQDMKPKQRSRNVPPPPNAYFWRQPTESDSRTLDSTDSELLVYGPGKFTISADIAYRDKVPSSKNKAEIFIELGVAGVARKISLNIDLNRVEPRDGELARWENR